VADEEIVAVETLPVVGAGEIRVLVMVKAMELPSIVISNFLPLYVNTDSS
jgi:hypothetical protein